MAHEIEFDADGRAQVLGRELWWHALNEPLGRNADWDDVERLVPVLTQEVEKLPMSDLIDPNEGWRVHDDEYGIVRADGQIIKTGVGERYTVVQAHEFYTWGSDVMEILGKHGEDAGLVSAVSIRGGRQYAFVFEQAEVEVNGVAFKGYFNLLGSHDGSMVNSLRPSNVITVCANTYTINLGNAAAFTFRHTTNVDERMEQALTILRETQEAKADFESLVRTLTTVRIMPREFDLLSDGLFPIADVAARTKAQNEAARDAVRALFDAPLNNGVTNTGWAFVQAVNSYEQWNAPIRKAKGLGTASTRAVRQFDALAKSAQPLTDRATELVLAGV
jgi:phage/plasmid-like protein (TIGR03299 family)